MQYRCTGCELGDARAAVRRGRVAAACRGSGGAIGGGTGGLHHPAYCLVWQCSAAAHAPVSYAFGGVTCVGAPASRSEGVGCGVVWRDVDSVFLLLPPVRALPVALAHKPDGSSA